MLLQGNTLINGCVNPAQGLAERVHVQGDTVAVSSGCPGAAQPQGADHNSGRAAGMHSFCLTDPRMSGVHWCTRICEPPNMGFNGGGEHMGPVRKRVPQKREDIFLVPNHVVLNL